MEYRYGDLSSGISDFRHTLYDQFNASYTYSGFTGSLRYEHFLSPVPDASYLNLSKYSLKYERKGFDIQLGNFDAKLGNGLLFSTFDLPETIYEDPLSRVRYGLFRDTRGVSMVYQGKYLKLKALHGSSLNYLSPPVEEEMVRRRDVSDAMETGFTYFGQYAGLVLLRNTFADQQDHFYSFVTDGGFLNILTYRFEFAHDISPGVPLLRKTDIARYAVYSFLSYDLGKLELSWEHCNYHGILIGSGVNLPVMVIKEHEHILLNRIMHQAAYSNERGSEFEAAWSFNRNTRLLLNYTRLLNRFYTTYLFREFYSEFEFHAMPLLNFTFFGDYSEEPFLNSDQRYTVGLISNYAIRNRHAAILDVEYQQIRPDRSNEPGYFNLALAGTFVHSNDVKVRISWELSDDPAYTDNSLRNWISAEFSMNVLASNVLTVFGGQRRGARVNQSGIFYDELDFTGVEIRLRSEF